MALSNDIPLIGEGYTEALHERWKVYKQWQRPSLEQHFIEMLDGSVTIHKWDVQTNRFILLNFYHGIAEYHWTGSKWSITRCDTDDFIPMITESKLKNYPGQRFKNRFSLQRETLQLSKEGVTVNHVPWEHLFQRWKETENNVSACLIPYADWEDLSASHLDAAYPITFMTHGSKNNLKLDQFYAEIFMAWFAHVDNAAYYYVIPKVLDSVPYGPIAKIPAYFLKDSLQNWVRARDFYMKMPLDEYRVLFDHDLPLTPAISVVPLYQEISIL